MFGRKRFRQHVADQLQTLCDHVETLSKQIEHVQREQPGVTIQYMQIDQAYLDELVFRLDSLEIQELSGSLNLGNNFHPKVSHTSVKRPDSIPMSVKSKQPETHDTPCDKDADGAVFGDGRRMNTTKRGYFITLS